MALEFNVVKLEKDSHNRHYNAKIEFEGRGGNYEIYTNAKFYFYDWLDGEGLENLIILDGNDCNFNEELPYLCIKALDVNNRENESKLKKAILKFIEEECSN